MESADNAVGLLRHKLTKAQSDRVKEIDARVRPYRELMAFFLNYICEEAKLPSPVEGAQFALSSDMEHIEGPVLKAELDKKENSN